MKTIEGKTVLTLKEASEKYDIPVYWLRRQIGKPVLRGNEILKYVKFPADRNVYVFELEVEEISKPRIYSKEFMEESREEYEKEVQDQKE